MFARLKRRKHMKYFISIFVILSNALLAQQVNEVPKFIEPPKTTNAFPLIEIISIFISIIVPIGLVWWSFRKQTIMTQATMTANYKLHILESVSLIYINYRKTFMNVVNILAIEKETNLLDSKALRSTLLEMGNYVDGLNIYFTDNKNVKQNITFDIAKINLIIDELSRTGQLCTINKQNIYDIGDEVTNLFESFIEAYKKDIDNILPDFLSNKVNK